MTAEAPKPGQVVRYAYLWREEAARGQDEGRKDRPCAVVLAVRREDARTRVYVVPMTHAPPSDPRLAVEVPAETKRRLGLDDAPSWIVTNDLNAFTWPGPDLRPVGGPGSVRGFVYGMLPTGLTRRIVEAVLAQVRDGRSKPTERDEAAPSRAHRGAKARSAPPSGSEPER